MKSPPPEDHIPFKNLGNVGTAFDSYLRARIQRMHKINQEEAFSDVAIRGLDRISTFNSKKELKVIRESCESAWALRNLYIVGDEIDTGDLATALLRLAYVENHGRKEGLMVRIEGYIEGSDVEYRDLINLIQNSKHDITLRFDRHGYKLPTVINPVLGLPMKLLSGADGDLIYKGGLYDFKTQKTFKYEVETFRQLLGYYILAKYGGSEEFSSISHLVVYNARYEDAAALDVDRLRMFIDLDQFAERFFEIMDGKSYRPAENPVLWMEEDFPEDNDEFEGVDEEMERECRELN
jgi:hypothetical protein